MIDDAYIERMQTRGNDYINLLRGEVFEVDGVEFAFFMYEVHRVAWALAADIPVILVWDRHATRHEFDRIQAQRYMAAAHLMMTERAARFHGDHDVYD